MISIAISPSILSVKGISVIRSQAVPSINLIIESYYELNADYRHDLQKFGLPVIFKSAVEIETEGIVNYLKIDDINYNTDHVSFWIDIIPWRPRASILAYFYREQGQWKRKY